MNEYKFYIKKIEQPSNDLLVLDLARPDNHEIFNFRPGQYVMLRFRNQAGVMEEKHTFSIASSPTEKDCLRLGIRISGRFTQELLKLAAGSEVIVYGPYGFFSFDESKHLNAVFLAGGIGITPFYSALAYASDKKLPNQFSLLYSSRTMKGIAFFEGLKKLEKKNPNIKTLFAVSDDRPASNMPGVINRRIDLGILEKFIETPQGKTFFLCGPPAFMKAIKECLLKFGATEEQILMEEFAMINNGSLFKKIAYVGNLAGWSVMAILLPFYLIYAANTKSTAGLSVLDNFFKDKDKTKTERGQAVLGETSKHLPLAQDKNPTMVSDAQATQGSKPNGITAGIGTVIDKISNSEIVSRLRFATVRTRANATGTKIKMPTPKTTLGAEATSGSQRKATDQIVPTPTTSASGATTAMPGIPKPANTSPIPTTGASAAVPSGGTASTGVTVPFLIDD